MKSFVVGPMRVFAGRRCIKCGGLMKKTAESDEIAIWKCIECGEYEVERKTGIRVGGGVYG